jgi:putative transposase
LEDARLSGLIRTSFLASDSTYGSPRVWHDLHDWGEHCSQKRVARLMATAGLQARAKRGRRPLDDGIRPEHSIAANVLDRQFDAEGPNRKWVADFSYVWTTEG